MMILKTIHVFNELCPTKDVPNGIHNCSTCTNTKFAQSYAGIFIIIIISQCIYITLYILTTCPIALAT